MREVLSKQSRKDYIPYNKSILTRILYESIKKRNTLTLAHFSKESTEAALADPKTLFSQLVKLGYSSLLTRSKISHETALRLLE